MAISTHSPLRAVAQFPSAVHRLHPAEDLFNPVPGPLADPVTIVAGGVPVDGRALLLGHMGRYLHPAARSHEAPGVTATIGAHVLMDNREGLVVDVRLIPAAGIGERDAALEMLASAPGTRRITVGADRGYDTRGFVRACRNLKVTPHVAQKQRSAIDRRTTRHDGYRVRVTGSVSGHGSGLKRSSAG